MACGCKNKGANVAANPVVKASPVTIHESKPQKPQKTGSNNRIIKREIK